MIETVVYCRDCKHRNNPLACKLESEGMYMPDDWFCADGELKDDDIKQMFIKSYISYKPNASREEIDKEYIHFANHVNRLATEYINSPYYDRSS